MNKFSLISLLFFCSTTIFLRLSKLLIFFLILNMLVSQNLKKVLLNICNGFKYNLLINNRYIIIFKLTIFKS